MHLHSVFLFAGRNKRIKQLSLQFILPIHMLRMPLDTQAEGMGGMYNGFHNPVLTDGTDCQILSQSIHSLVMEAVDGKNFRFHNMVQSAAGHHSDFMAAEIGRAHV